MRIGRKMKTGKEGEKERKGKKTKNILKPHLQSINTSEGKR